MNENQPVENKASAQNLGYVGRTPGTPRDSNAWFTPEKYLNAVRSALGGTITLDPFSSSAANTAVKAEEFYDEADNAFDQDWSKNQNGRNSSPRTVFMNPPYSGKLCSLAVSRFLDEYEKGSFTAGIFLVNNSTETKWFQRALKTATAICFTDHRISFWNVDGKAMSGNTRGQAFFYFGKNPQKFIKAFAELGSSFVLNGAAGK